MPMTSASLKKLPVRVLPFRWLAVSSLLLLSAGLIEPAAAQTLEEKLLAEDRAALAAAAKQHGDAARGAAIFYARAMACSTCHSVGDRAETIGPDLTKIEKNTPDADLVEAVLEPSKTIKAPYASVAIETQEGQLLIGMIVEETETQILLRDAADTKVIRKIEKANVAAKHKATQSLMPAAQVNQLADRGQFLDLVRYLIELRDGGAARARELQPPADPLTQKIPDEPLPWQPVVQRGEVAVEGNVKYPHGVALGFAGGTVLFDAVRLQPVAAWVDGFVKSSPQNYFGLFWHRDGAAPDQFLDNPHTLRFKLSDTADWQDFEPSLTSDPNTGTRFDGYQIGKSAVRVNYHVRVGELRVAVSEDIRAESRPDWQGFVRELRFTGLPAGAQVGLSLFKGGTYEAFSAEGAPLSGDAASSAPLLRIRSDGVQRVVRGAAPGGFTWKKDGDDATSLRLVSGPADGKTPLVLRLDAWTYRGQHSAPTRAELTSLITKAPQLDDDFDAPKAPAAPLPLATATQPDAPAEANRPPVQPQENVDEFSPVTAKFLRFNVTRTSNNAEPGIDELEIYGADPKVNLAPSGKATASSVIRGYAIHQIPHLNDAKLGNENSWISGEPGKGWAQIEFAEPLEMRKIVWARDRTGKCGDRLATSYRIEVSDDGQNWKVVGTEQGRETAGHAVGMIRRDASPGYELEAIPAPFPTWRPSDVVFSDDGAMYAIAMTEGQIWRSRTPPPGSPNQVKWERYASGLYHPTGLAIVDGRIYVAQKPEITELIDRNGDGVVDQYRTVATGWGLSTGWHEYCFGLAVDDAKNLWFTLNTGYFWTNPGYVNPGRWRGSIFRVAHDTEKLEEMAKGCRVPNGIARGPEGSMFFTDNQGDWIQACKLAHIVPGRFYGHPETKADALASEKYPDGRSAIWLPYERCRSVSGPVVDATGGQFGPFANQMFVGDVGYGANAGIMRVALEKVDGEYQGACFPFVDGQPLGCQRLRFGPDRRLYMTSLTSGLTRMAFTGQTPLAMHSVNIRPAGKGFVVNFTKPLAEGTELKPEQIRVTSYHYLYTGNYGSPKADEKHDAVEAVELSPDRKSITLTLPVETYPIGMVYHMQLPAVRSGEGDEMLHKDAWYTVHKIPQ